MSSNFVKFKFVKTNRFNYCVDWGFLKVNSNNISEIIDISNVSFNPAREGNSHDEGSIAISESVVDEFYNFVFGKKIIIIETIGCKKYYIKKMKKILIEKIIMNNKNEYITVSV
jgi:hypothetical protein